jgi:hypothetical protein
VAARRNDGPGPGGSIENRAGRLSDPSGFVIAYVIGEGLDPIERPVSSP